MTEIRCQRNWKFYQIRSAFDNWLNYFFLKFTKNLHSIIKSVGPEILFMFLDIKMTLDPTIFHFIATCKSDQQRVRWHSQDKITMEPDETIWRFRYCSYFLCSDSAAAILHILRLCCSIRRDEQRQRLLLCKLF